MPTRNMSLGEHSFGLMMWVLSVLTKKNGSRLVGEICKMKKLTSNSINNTNRAMLSKSGFGDRQTELYDRGSHAPTIDI
jgi:hypothetical protein